VASDQSTLSTLEQRNRELEVLIEIGKALTSTLDLGDVLTLIMEQLRRLLHSQAWSLFLREADSGELSCEIAATPAGPHKDTRLPQGTGTAGWVAERGEALLIPDLRLDPRFTDTTGRSPTFTPRSVLCVPIRNRDAVLGVIELVNDAEERSFTRDDLQVLATIADYAAIAIGNARNFRRINELVITDDLTGLYNCRHLYTLLDEEIERVRRFGGKLSVIFIDLDFFKRVNDTRGHLIGSRTLAEVGRLIRGNIRKICKAARYGGDEFVVVLPNTGKSGAMALATRLRELFREHTFRDDDDTPFNLTASFGLATFPSDANSREELLRIADQAMYRVKASTRDAVQSA
jgi:diguanylate cyclase (GGDEF)-like protein